MRVVKTRKERGVKDSLMWENYTELLSVMYENCNIKEKIKMFGTQESHEVLKSEHQWLWQKNYHIKLLRVKKSDCCTKLRKDKRI